MRQEAIDARVLGTRQLFERHFGTGVQIEVIRPLQFVEETLVAQVQEPVPLTTNPSLNDVRAMLGECERCSLCSHRTSIVFGHGNPHADLMVIGDAPTPQEDEASEPFVGSSGVMLDKMLQRVVQVPREHAYVVNIVKCQTAAGRKPTDGELASCLPFLERQVLAIGPKVILVMGSVALKALLGTEQGIGRHRGKWMEYLGIPVMPTFHPSYLARKPEDKRVTMSDLQQVYDRLQDSRGHKP